MRQAMTGVVASADGVPIAYEAQGVGSPALVLVHGWSCDRGYWAGQLEPFSREFRVVAIDLAGHGESGLERGRWTIEAFGDDVAAVVEALGLERVILVGHSMGGDAIVEAAHRLPGRVAGLVWVDVYKRLGTPRSPAEVEARIAPLRGDFARGTRAFVRSMFCPDADPALVERVVADMSAAPPAIALEAARSAWSYEPTAGLRRLKLPVVAINADDSPTDVESMARHGVEVVVMPGVGHFPMMEDAEEFNRLLSGAVGRLAR